MFSMDISVNVFDMNVSFNEQFRFLNFGIYHTSVVVNQTEIYFWGDYQSEETGIIQKRTQNPPTAPGGFKFYRTYHLGKSKYSNKNTEKIIQAFIKSPYWKAKTYSLCYHNCNSFTYDFCTALLTPLEMKNYPYFACRLEKIGRFLWNISLSYYLGSTSVTSEVMVPPPEEKEDMTEGIIQETPRYINFSNKTI